MLRLSLSRILATGSACLDAGFDFHFLETLFAWAAMPIPADIKKTSNCSPVYYFRFDPLLFPLQHFLLDQPRRDCAIICIKVLQPTT
jgi:hypothetical protein